MNRDRFLLVLGAQPEEWAARYDIEPYTWPCSDCGASLTTSIPFAVGQLRGLLAPPCACGNTKTPYCLVRDPRYGDLLDAPLTAPARRRS